MENHDNLTPPEKAVPARNFCWPLQGEEEAECIDNFDAVIEEKQKQSGLQPADPDHS